MTGQSQLVTPVEWRDVYGVAGGPPSSIVFGVDFETYYTGSYSVAQMGTWAYVHDPRFDAWAVSVTDGRRTCVCAPAEFPWETIAGREWVSHNRAFDQAVAERLLERGTIGAQGPARPTQWYCSAALCAYLQLPRDLAGAVRAVFGIEMDKSVRAKSKGRDGKNGRDGRGTGELELLLGLTQEQEDYAAADAEMCLALWQELEDQWPAHERRLFELTSEMGATGLNVDWEYVAANRRELNELVASMGAALPWSPALSIKKFREACEAAGIWPPKSTSASDPHFSDWLRENIRTEAATWVRHMQRIRSANRTAKVLESMETRRTPSGRLAYELKYFGATTGRWSGGGGLNLQNLNRKAAEGVDLRRCIVPAPGKVLGVVDYSQIESRVLLFLAGDVQTLEMFRANPEADAYEIHARATMGWTPSAGPQTTDHRPQTGEEKTTDHTDCTDGKTREESLKEYCERTGSGLRQLAKARVLGLGFSCGARRFVEVAKVMAGLDIGEAESERIVKEFRESNPLIVSLWRRLNDACAACDGGTYALPLPCTQFNPDLNRYLLYREVTATEDGLECTICGERVRVYGGLLAENWTQATARDVMASAWLRCVDRGYRPILSVHDELVFELNEGTAEAELAEIQTIMAEPLAWAQALPLRTDGKLCRVYEK